jgi:hypothetical protein
MHFDWSTLALQTVNFAILVWLMHRFLYRPVLRLIDARRAEIDKQHARRMTEAKGREPPPVETETPASRRTGGGANRRPRRRQKRQRRGVVWRSARRQNFSMPRARRSPLSATWL